MSSSSFGRATSKARWRPMRLTTSWSQTCWSTNRGVRVCSDSIQCDDFHLLSVYGSGHFCSSSLPSLLYLGLGFFLKVLPILSGLFWLMSDFIISWKGLVSRWKKGYSWRGGRIRSWACCIFPWTCRLRARRGRSLRTYNVGSRCTNNNKR